MAGWRRWLRAPATHWLRRVLFQVHLWLGLTLGLYVLVISVSGSAIVLRPYFTRWFVPSEVPSVAGEAMTGATLDARIAATYPDHDLVMTLPSTREGRAVYVVLQRNGEEHTRFFDQYAGQDLGASHPWQVATIEWLTQLHDDLLLGRTGRRLNGIGGALFLGMVVTGAVLWWQGSARWHQGLVIRSRHRRGFNWQLHSFLGFWSLFLLFIWGLTAVYFAWSAPFETVIDWFDADPNDVERPDAWLRWMVDLHFGRFRGLMWANVLWIVLGLIPAVLFITGFLVWYRRIKRNWLS